MLDALAVLDETGTVAVEDESDIADARVILAELVQRLEEAEKHNKELYLRVLVPRDLME